MNNNNYKAHLALFGANLIYGFNYIIAKGIMPNKLGPSAFVFIRLICATLLFWLLKLVFFKEQISKKDKPRLILCGLLGAATNQLLFFHGINLTSPIDASIIMTSVPVLVLVFSFFLLKERFTKHKIIGISIGSLGAILLIVYANNAGGTSSFLGNLSVFINACSYSAYLVIVKPLMKKYSAITIISWVFLFGFVLMLPFGLPDFLNTNFNAFSLNTYLSIGYVIVFTTFFAYLFNIYALNYVSPSVNSSYIYLQPAINFIIVSVYAFILNQGQYKEDIDLVKIGSCLLVVLGVYFISKKPKQKSITN